MTPPLFLAPGPGAPPAPRPVRRLLIANRGEIALRIIRTCKALAIETVAIYADVDASSPHVAAADMAICLGPMPGASAEAGEETVNPYMDSAKLIKVAQDNGCDALHPGYGYLSENAYFADAVAKAPGLRFVGPKGEVMRQMGDKSNSKRLLRERMGKEAPLVPGYDGQAQDDESLVKEGIRVGFPLLIKASAGGGGRGMRIVRDEKSLGEEIARARSEAQRSFGSPTLLLERYIEGGKHIEVQIFGDSHGKVISLGERECSVQRRHQKVIEESPARCFEGPENAARREALHESARKIGQLLGYEGAATIEYIYDAVKKEFFFLEVNTRLQVEHPVSELVFGLDFVSLQLYIAGGGKIADLPAVLNAKSSGSAIECRLCAEEPGAEFAPRTGVIRLHSTPIVHLPGFRSDSGVTTGSVVSTFFDSMLAKLIVHGASRAEAIDRMQRMLQSSPFLGPAVNTSFMSSCLAHPTFADGSYTTALIPENLDALLERANKIAPAVLSHPAAGGVESEHIPVHAVVPALLLFRHIRAQLRPQRAGMAPWLRLHSSDRAQDSTENYVVTLPDGGREWDVQVRHRPLPGPSLSGTPTTPTVELWLWLNRADEVEKATLKTISEKAKKKAEAKAQKDGSAAPAKATPPSLVQTRTAATARFYAGLANRSGQEGRLDSEWTQGTKEDKMVHVRATLQDVELEQHTEAGSVGTGSTSRWITATIRVDVGGRTSTHVLATDETFDKHEEGAQAALLWCPAIAGQIRIVRRNLRVWAGRLEASGQKGGGADDSAYKTPMPCRILQVLAKDGDKVEAGQALLVMESMKTEVTLRAHRAGVLSIALKQGDTIGEGQILCSVDPDAE